MVVGFDTYKIYQIEYDWKPNIGRSQKDCGYIKIM